MHGRVIETEASRIYREGMKEADQKRLKQDAKAMLEKNDRQRADYYNEHTGKVWGDVSNYHMILDTTTLGIENCADIMIKYFHRVEII